MKKLLFVFALLTAMALLFASCGTDSDDSAHKHEFGEWTVTKEAACTSDGEKVSSCSCGEKQTAVIPSLGHDYDSIKTEPTCTQEGSKIYTCAECNYSYEKKIDALGHTYENGVCVRCGASGSNELKYSEGLTYELNDEGAGYIVTGIGTCTDSELVIPNMYNGLPVVEIRYRAFA